jgi:hypothetical protein
MEWDDKVGHARLVCAASGRPIAPGEVFYSVLRYTDGGFVRDDFCDETWSAKPADERGLSWWRQRRPLPKDEASGPRMIAPAALLQIFKDLRDTPERPAQCFAWMLCLLLLRAKQLRYLDLQHDSAGTWLLVQERGGAKAGARGFRVRDPGMGTDEQQRVQEDLARVFELPPETAAAAGAALTEEQP